MGNPGDPADFSVSPVEGAQLRGEREGEGEPVLLLHGLSATRRYVVQGSRLLARRGHRVLAYDARGHGASSPAPVRSAYEYADLLADLRTVLDELGLDRVALAGSSMGAATATAFALAEPDRVTALVAITPAYDGSPRADAGEWPLLADALQAGDIDAFVARSGVLEIPQRYREPAALAVRQRLERHEHLGAVADALRVVPHSRAFDGLDGLDELDVPVLIVGSRDDSDAEHPLAVAREYDRRLPRSQLVVEDEGQSPLAWRGARLSRAIDEFLADPPG